MLVVRIADLSSEVITFWFYLQLCFVIRFCRACVITLLQHDADSGGVFIVGVLVGPFGVYVCLRDVDAFIFSRAVDTELTVSCVVLGAGLSLVFRLLALSTLVSWSRSEVDSFLAVFVVIITELWSLFCLLLGRVMYRELIANSNLVFPNSSSCLWSVIPMLIAG